jgi:hypothetical protein
MSWFWRGTGRVNGRGCGGGGISTDEAAGAAEDVGGVWEGSCCGGEEEGSEGLHDGMMAECSSMWKGIRKREVYRSTVALENQNYEDRSTAV